MICNYKRSPPLLEGSFISLNSERKIMTDSEPKHNMTPEELGDALGIGLWKTYVEDLHKKILEWYKNDSKNPHDFNNDEINELFIVLMLFHVAFVSFYLTNGKIEQFEGDEKDALKIREKIDVAFQCAVFEIIQSTYSEHPDKLKKFQYNFDHVYPQILKFVVDPPEDPKFYSSGILQILFPEKTKEECRKKAGFICLRIDIHFGLSRIAVSGFVRDVMKETKII